MDQFNSLIVIPARYESSRFPGKPLQMIQGKSLIQRVYNQAAKSQATDVVVATDDQRIFDHVKEFDGNVIMTSAHIPNGTARCAAALEEMEAQDQLYDMVINVQGDEPLIDPEDINRIIEAFKNDEDIQIGTLAKRIKTTKDLDDPNVVKVVLTEFDEMTADAIYFSRSPIPFVRDMDREEAIKKQTFYKHIGLYAFIPEVLQEVVQIQDSNLEKLERLEQLGWLENHFVITVLETESDAIGVDTPEDLALVENFLKRRADSE